MLRPLFTLCILLIAGCGHESTKPVESAELPLDVQIQNVEQEVAAEIRVTKPFARSQLPRIVALSNLVRLNLSETDLTDEDAKQIAALPMLETLRFSSPTITDQTLLYLATSPTLRHLILSDSPITDAGLAHLAELKTLESLYLTNTRVTDAGLSALLQRRPTLHVH